MDGYPDQRIDEKGRKTSRAKTTRTKSKSTFANDFYDVNLDSGTIEHIKGLDYDWRVLMDFMHEGVVEQGYRFTFSFDTRSGAVALHISGYTEDNPNKGRVMASRAPDIKSVLTIALFKIVEIAGWDTWQKNQENDEQWG